MADVQNIFIPPKHPVPKGGKDFNLVSEFEPSGDQPQAIAELVKGIQEGEKDQVLLG